MCIAAPGRIIKVEGRKALVDYVFLKRQVLIGGENVKVGDYVMVQMGIITKIISRKEALAASASWLKLSR